MATRKRTGSMAGPAPKPPKKPTGRQPGTSRPDPAVAARRDFMTNKTGPGSGRTTYNRTSTWQSQYDLEMSRLKRNAMTKSGQGSGRSSRNGSEGPKKRKPRLPGTK